MKLLNPSFTCNLSPKHVKNLAICCKLLSILFDPGRGSKQWCRNGGGGGQLPPALLPAGAVLPFAFQYDSNEATLANLKARLSKAG